MQILCQIPDSFQSNVVLLRAVAVFAHALQIMEAVSTAVALRDNVIDIHVAFAHFPTAAHASIPAVVGLIGRKPSLSITHFGTSFLFKV